MKRLLLSTALVFAAVPALAERIFVSSELDNTVTVLDVDYAGKRIYIGNEDDSMVTMMTVEGEVLKEIGVGIEPEGTDVSPDDSIVVTTSESTGMAHFIDTEKLELVGNTVVDTRPRHAEFQFDGSKVWVTSEIGGTVSVLDAKAFAFDKVISSEITGVKPELIQPVGLRFSGGGQIAFVALGPSNHVAVIDVAEKRWRTTSPSVNAPGTSSAALTTGSSTWPTGCPTT